MKTLKKTCGALLHCALYLFIAFFPIPQAFTQTTASLAGSVLDNTSAVIPNAHVILTDENSHDHRELITNSAGFFNFAGIKPGPTPSM